MRWDLVPFFWKKTLKELPSTFNARRDSRQQANVPLRIQELPLHHPGVGLIRMDRREGRQAAAPFHRRRRFAHYGSIRRFVKARQETLPILPIFVRAWSK
jgi:hypothetical protein